MAPQRLVLVIALLLAACTSGAGDGADGPAAPGKTIGPPGVGTAELGVGTVELAAPPVEGAGPVPVFEWRPTEGAAEYRLAVLDSGGAAIWAWQGEATSITLGGVPNRPPEAEGPVLTGPSSWSVAALDGEGHVIAVSVLRPVSP